MTQVAEMLQVSVVISYDVINKPNYLGLTERYVAISICNCSAVPELVRVPTDWKQEGPDPGSHPRRSQGTP